VSRSRMSRGKMQKKAKKAKKTLDALNELGLALANHGHKWTRKQRLLYNYAARWLASFCDEDLEA
jgi:flagellin-specific chaperone FliS